MIGTKALTLSRRFSRGDSGAVALTVALALPFVFGVLSLGLDVARVNSVTGQMQTAADAAALAGADTLARDGAVTGTAVCTNARQIAWQNQSWDAGAAAVVRVSVGTWGNGKGDAGYTEIAVCSAGSSGSLEWPDERPPNAIHVLVSRKQAAGNAIDLPFASLFGIGGADRSVEAVARIDAPPERPPSIFVARNGRLALDRGARVDVPDQKITAASRDASAIRLRRGAWLRAKQIATPGAVDARQGGRVDVTKLTGALDAGFMAVPRTATDSRPRRAPASGRLEPAYYDSLRPRGRLTLAPGIYHVASGIQVTEGAELVAGPGVELIVETGDVLLDRGGRVTATGSLQMRIVKGALRLDRGAWLNARPLTVAAQDIALDRGARLVSEPDGRTVEPGTTAAMGSIRLIR